MKEAASVGGKKQMDFLMIIFSFSSPIVLLPTELAKGFPSHYLSFIFLHDTHRLQSIYLGFMYGPAVIYAVNCKRKNMNA